MKITIKRELDVEELFEELVNELSDYPACDEADLSDTDFTPKMVAEIFSELAKIAARRAQ